MNWLEFIYPLSVTLIFLLIYIVAKIRITKTEKRKLKGIEKRDIYDAVETESPISDQEQDLKNKGISQLEDKFNFFSQALPIVLALLWSAVVFIPYLDRIPTAYISVVVAIVSVVTGVALRPFLENLFSGIIISFFKSIKIGDTVRIDGHYGLIEEIGLTYSVLKRWDWERLIVPNSKMLNKEIQNLTMNDRFIWAYIEFYIAPDSDLESVEKIAKKVALASDYNCKIEDPSFWVMGLNENSIKCWLAAWAETPSDAWELRHEMRYHLIKEMQKHQVNYHKFNITSSS